MDFDKVSPKSMDFLQKVAEYPDDFNKLANALICEMETKNLIIPDFSDSFGWLNTSDKLSFKGNLRNKLCVLDFFTYCCINCMHVLPDLHALEKTYSIEDGVAVIGVHSAKFENEKVLSNILSAVLRYDICHPVVNDSDAEMWNTMGIQCWPTFVIVSPEGKALLYLVGEGHRNVLVKFVHVALDFYKQKGLISNHSLPIRLCKESMAQQQFKFPGKLAVSGTNGSIAVADTGNHQVVVLDQHGVVTRRIGSGEAGFEDGSFSTSRFHAPQGLTWYGNFIFVADTENHAIRKVSLDTNDVVTVAGIGKQGSDKGGGEQGIKQEISSPWDVLIAPSPGCDITQKDSNCMYIAMAGTHQIWCYFLQDGGWLKKGSQEKGTCLCFAGNGNEENRNNSYPHKASFAQPSGVTWGITKDKHFLYVADSESSSVRCVEILSGAVKACVGGERDPTNLFAYGDCDGKGVAAKLQHPLAVEYNPLNGLVYVADSYNHKIKVVDPTKQTCVTIAGTGNAGLTNGTFLEATFNEPGDLKFSADCRLLYIADTNNHVIRVLDMEEETVSTFVTVDGKVMDTLEISDTNEVSPMEEYKPLVGKNVKITMLEKVARNLEKEIIAGVQVDLSDELEFTEDVDSKFQISINDMGGENIPTFRCGTILKNGHGSTNITSTVVSSHLEVTVEFLLFVCTKDKTCLMKQHKLQQIISHDKDGSHDDIILTLHVSR